jgi:hypothetical protein
VEGEGKKHAGVRWPRAHIENDIAVAGGNGEGALHRAERGAEVGHGKGGVGAGLHQSALAKGGRGQFQVASVTAARRRTRKRARPPYFEP